MKKGSLLIGACGALQIIFAIYLFALCGVLFSSETFVLDLSTGFVEVFNSSPSIEVTRNGFLAIFVVLAFFALVLGVLRFKQIRVELGEYYKDSSKLVSSMIYMLICACLFFVLFGICNQADVYIPLILVAAIIPLVTFLVTLFAIVVFHIGKKNSLKPKPASIVATGDHYTALKRLNSLKESGEISKKEYEKEKEKILGK